MDFDLCEDAAQYEVVVHIAGVDCMPDEGATKDASCGEINVSSSQSFESSGEEGKRTSNGEKSECKYCTTCELLFGRQLQIMQHPKGYNEDGDIDCDDDYTSDVEEQL